MVAMWLRSYVAIWLYGYVAMWRLGFVSKSKIQDCKVPESQEIKISIPRESCFQKIFSEFLRSSKVIWYILWATPSAAGPRSLPIASGLQILCIVASASWHHWYANLSFGMIGCFTLACWGTLGQFWDIGEHNKQPNNTLRSRP